MRIETNGERRKNAFRVPKVSSRTIFVLLAVFFVGILLYQEFLSPPPLFPKDTLLVIPKGFTLSQASGLLKDNHMIRHPMLFETIVVILGGESSVRYGDYKFSSPESAFTIARRVVSADFGLVPVSITIPEGITVAQVGDIFKKQLPGFNADVFVRIAKKDEGYLFPDTYRFFPNVSELEAYRTMRSMFDKKIASVQDEISKSGKELKDIIVMASLLEKEARTMETRRMISGILWKRLSIGMPLQVDAVFEYILGKNTYMLTTEDLRFNSPYNTYIHKGLPPGPIASPGLVSIQAALNPIESPYLFYLSDREGNVYYSRTHDEHVQKKARYL